MMRFLWPWALGLLALPFGVLVWAIARERALLGRAFTLLFLVLALGQPEISLREERERVVFLVDRSGSVGDSGAEAFWDLAKSAAERGAEVGVVVFAGESVVLRPPMPGLPKTLDVPAALDRERTDLGAALDLGLSLLGEKGQLVLISDGRDTEGKLWAAALRARLSGVPIHVFPAGRADPIRLLDFRGPNRVPLGKAELVAQITAERDLSAKASLLLNGNEVETRELTLSPGIHEIPFTLVLDEPGVFQVSLFLDVPGDPVPENNALHWALEVGDVPGILVVGEGESAVDALLSGANLPFRRVKSLDPRDLGEANLVILDDYPLSLLGPRVLEALRAFLVRGGGLWVIQGRRALTGYAGSIEEILPVTYSVPHAFQEAEAAIVFVLDRSASMAGRAGPTTKIELLKDATAAAAEWIPDRDLLGAIAFDRTAFWLAFPGPASSTKPLLFSGLAGLTPSGGTDLWPAVELALSALSQVSARIRHIILVSDGKTVREGRNFQALFDRVRESGVGFTSIAIGPDPDLEILSGLAGAGGGELYVLPDPRELRAILVTETKRALRPRFLEGNFPVLPGPEGEGFADLFLPPLSGYALTFPKPTAEVALLSALGDPILAFGQVGLGRVAVLNTDLRGAWSKEWLSAPDFGEFFGRLISKVWSERASVEVSWKKEGQRIRVFLDVAESGRWVQGLSFRGSLVGPGGSLPLEFRQSGPGRYEAEIPAFSSGSWLLTFSEESGRFRGRTVLPLPYPPEFSELGPDPTTLESLARLTGGKVLEDEEIPELKGEKREWVPLWPIVLWTAAGSFLLDLGLRKVIREKGARKEGDRLPSV